MHDNVRARASAAADTEAEAPPRRSQRDTPRERTCISCGKPFPSEGWHNRLCGQCRRRGGPEG